MLQIQSLAGILVLLVIAWLFSENRRLLHWRIIVTGVVLQFALALLLTQFPPSRDLFLMLNGAVIALQEATKAGTSFLFGYLGGGTLPFEESFPGGSFILAFQALPLVLVVSALSALLFHWGILQRIVGAFSWLLQKIMGIRGALGLGAAANIFVGMVEAPLLIRPYLAQMARRDLFAIMSCGMATIAGTMMVLYAGLLGSIIPNALGQILTASLISAPAALVVALIMVPGQSTKAAKAEYGESVLQRLALSSEDRSSMDAITRGTTDGITLLLNIVGMLIVLVALVALANQILALLPAWGGEAITVQRLLGYLMAPVVWIMGIPWAEAQTAGMLMGSKTVLNEFIAYMDLAKLPEGALSERSRMMMIYALCGFANLGSLGILIGGMGTMVPERRDEIVSLGMRSIVAGTLATCMTGAVMGVIV